MHLTKNLPGMFAFVLVVAACGGGTTPSTAAAPAAPAATPAATDDGGGVEATATPAAEGGGSGIDDFCLNTVEEVSAAFEVEVGEATSSENPGLGGACLYTDVDGALVFGLSVITARARLTGLRVAVTPATAPAARVLPSMIAASSSLVPS